MKAYNAITWTTEMIDFLQKNHSTMTNKQLAEGVGVEPTSTRHKCYALGLYKMKLQKWTTEQIEFLKANYKTKGDIELAEIFNSKWTKDKGWSKTHIAKKRGYLKFKRSPAELIAIRETHKLNGVYSEGNKRMWQNRGANPIGTVVTWAGHRFIKTEKGYQHVRVYNYKKFIGPIPKGMLVIHKDKNPLNCEPDNLQLIDRAENAKRNCIARYPPELRKEIWKLIKLKRIINKKIKDNEQTNF